MKTTLLDNSGILFISSGQPNCGVYQYGESVSGVLNALHVCVDDLASAELAIEIHAPEFVVWNYHSATLGRFLTSNSPRKFRAASICLLHEFDEAFIGGGFFDIFVMPDPTNRYLDSRFFVCGRLIKYFKNDKPAPPSPVIGSFGFGLNIKGYKKLLGLVSDSYDKASIRLHIPPNWSVDPDGLAARQIGLELINSAAPDIRVETSHQWMSELDLLSWLSDNTINVFPYDAVPHPGISSSTDWALASRRPLAITKCGLFKHLSHLPIVLESYSLKEIVSRGTEPIEPLWEEWNVERFLERWNVILSAASAYGLPRASSKIASNSSSAQEPAVSISRVNDSWTYNPSFLDQLRFPFPGAKLILANYSQAWQDLFVICMLDGICNATYLEVGANDPVTHNNTYLLSKHFGWRGVSIEHDCSHLSRWMITRPTDSFLIADALLLDYDALISTLSRGGGRIDYLQLDIEPSFNTLSVLKRLPLDKIRFSVITFETDAYAGDHRARDESRHILERYGYKRVGPNIGVLCESVSPNLIAFEDWWVDPVAVDAEKIERMRPLVENLTIPQKLLFKGGPPN